MDEDHFLFLLVGLSVITLAYCWWLWFRSAVKFPPSQARTWAEFVALVAVTLSLSIPFSALLPVIPRLGKASFIAWVLPALTLALSFFGHGKLRIAELICGGRTCWFWWEVWQSANDVGSPRVTSPCLPGMHTSLHAGGILQERRDSVFLATPAHARAELAEEASGSEEPMLKEMKQYYLGNVIAANDLDVIRAAVPTSYALPHCVVVEAKFGHASPERS